MWLKTEMNGLVNLDYVRRIDIVKAVRKGDVDCLYASLREDGEFYEGSLVVGVLLSSSAYYPDMEKLLRGIEVALNAKMPYLSIAFKHPAEAEMSEG